MYKRGILLLTLALPVLAAPGITDKIRQQNLQVVQKAAEGLNETLPQQIDRYTRLIRLEPKGEKLIYIYELNVTGKSDAEVAAEGRKRMRKPVTEGICTSSKRFLQSGIDIVYRYESAKSHKPLFAFDVTQKDCHYRGE